MRSRKPALSEAEGDPIPARRATSLARDLYPRLVWYVVRTLPLASPGRLVRGFWRCIFRKWDRGRTNEKKAGV